MTSFSQFSDYQESEARLKVNNFANKSNATSDNFPIESLVKEIRLVIRFKDEFEGDKSKEKATFGLSEF